MIKSELYKLLKNQVIIIIGIIFGLGSFLFNVLFMISSQQLENKSVLLALNIISYIIFSLLLSVLSFREEVKASNFFNIVVSGSERQLYIAKLVSYFSFISIMNFSVNIILVFSNMVEIKNAIVCIAVIEISMLFIVLIQNIMLILVDEVYLFIYTGIELLIIIFISNTDPSKMWIIFPSNYGYGIYQRMFKIDTLEISIMVGIFLMLVLVNYISIKKIKEKEEK